MPGPYRVAAGQVGEVGWDTAVFHSASSSCSRIHFRMRRSRREIWTWVVPRTRAVSLWVRPAKKRRRMSWRSLVSSLSITSARPMRSESSSSGESTGTSNSFSPPSPSVGVRLKVGRAARMARVICSGVVSSVFACSVSVESRLLAGTFQAALALGVDLQAQFF